MADQTPLRYDTDENGVTTVTYANGEVQTIAPGGTTPVTQPSGGNIDVRYDPQGGAIPVAPQVTPTDSPPSQSGAPSSSGRGYQPRSYDYGSGGSDYQARGPDPQYAGGGDLAGLGDRIRSANNDRSGGDAYREQIYSPSGAGAGPFGASAPSGEWPEGTHRAFDAAGRPYSGGGGNTSPLYDALRAKGDALAAKLKGYGGSTGSVSSGASGVAPTSGPARPEPMRGEYAKGLDPGQASGLGMRPQMLLPEVFPGLSGASPLYQSLAGLPAAQLGMLTHRGYDGSPSDLANAVGHVYEHAGEDNRLPSFDKTFGNLSNPKAGGGIDTLFGGEKAGKGDQESYSAPGYVYGSEPLAAADAAYQYSGLLDATLSLLPGETALKYGSQPGGYGSFLIDKWGSKALKKPAGNGKQVTTFVGKRLMR